MPSLPQNLVPDNAPQPKLRRLTLQEAASCLAAGGIVIFPTETLYAIGCLADKPDACGRLCAIKRRPDNAPLPLLAANRAQANRAVHLEAAPQCLLERFWPGPLSLLLPARPGLAPQARNTQGLAALRVTPHPLASQLAALAGGALTASSANFSGDTPVARVQDLDTALLSVLARAECDTGLLVARTPDEEPGGGSPSTLALPLSGVNGQTLRLLRRGAISQQTLIKAGFQVVE